VGVSIGAGSNPARRAGLRPACARWLAALACALPVLAIAEPAQASAIDHAVAYLESRQQTDGGFAEPGSTATPGLTAWAVLGLAAVGQAPDTAAAYLTSKPYPTATDLALRLLALDALGRDVDVLADQLEGLGRPNGGIGQAVNSTIWGVIALRAAGRTIESDTVRFLTDAQQATGGWSWGRGIAPDADDTAAAIQALRAAGVSKSSAAVRRGLAFLRARQNPDGGFELVERRGSNAQSTSWALQAFVAAGRDAGAKARAYLARLQRDDGSFRLSSSYVTTPVWVTSQVVAALAGRAFPL
jgi:prenyltransferase beta subunit